MCGFKLQASSGIEFDADGVTRSAGMRGAGRGVGSGAFSDARGSLVLLHGAPQSPRGAAKRIRLTLVFNVATSNRQRKFDV